VVDIGLVGAIASHADWAEDDCRLHSPEMVDAHAKPIVASTSLFLRL
jgi:hypothetical protein